MPGPEQSLPAPHLSSELPPQADALPEPQEQPPPGVERQQAAALARAEAARRAIDRTVTGQSTDRVNDLQAAADRLEARIPHTGPVVAEARARAAQQLRDQADRQAG